MLRFLEHDAPTRSIHIRFAYDAAIVGVVKTLPHRRWHADGKFWSIPEASLTEAARTLVPLGFALSEELKKMLLGGESATEVASGEVPWDGAAPPVVVREEQNLDYRPERAPVETLSISELNDSVRGVIARAFPGPVWIAGEVIGFDRNAHKKHVYFQLAEKADGEDKPRAVVTAVLFAGARPLIESRLRGAADPVDLKDGLKIRVLARADLYPPSGSYQIILEDIDPEFSLGELARRREQVLAEIEKLGLRERNAALAFPRPALRVGLITSFGSDAYNDFVNELERSGFAFDIAALDVHVQGAAMEAELLRALAHFAARADDYDIIAIVRGGGSRTDLMHFDSLAIGLAVARHPVKIMVGIGHHRDRSVLDFIAQSEKTPTACARRLITLAEEEALALARGAERLAQLSERRMTRERAWLERSAPLLARSLQLSLERALARVHGWARDLDQCCAGRFEQQRFALFEKEQTLGAGTLHLIARQGLEMERGRQRLMTAAPQRIARAEERLAARLALLRSADPARVLARGYAWLKDAKGKSVKSAAQVAAGEELSARVADGELELRVMGARRVAPKEEATGN